jgi:hypothetical protein
MMRVNSIALAMVICSITFVGAASAETACDVKRVVQLDTNVPDVTVLTRNGETVELRQLIEAFVVPAKITPGVYEVNVRRKSSNLYEIPGKRLQIETRYCYEYTYGEDAILKITSTSGWSVGTLIFE